MVYVLHFHYTLWTAERTTLEKWCLLFFLDKENSITNTNYFTYLQRSLTQLAIYRYGSIYSWQLRNGNCNKIWHLKKMACVEEDGSQQNIFNDTSVLSFFLLIYSQGLPFLPGKGRWFILIGFNHHFSNYIFAQRILLSWNSLRSQCLNYLQVIPVAVTLPEFYRV